MPTPFAERLAQAVLRHRTPLCVGLDPRLDLLPRELSRRHSQPAAAIEEFCLRVLDLVAPLVGVVKPQSAFFEAHGPAGLQALQHVIQRARQLNLVTILDAKRGDIASTAAAYAEAAFVALEADALTINPYLGRDSIEPFLTAARDRNRGLFVLARTSNAGAGLFQDLPCAGRPLYQHVAAAIAQWNEATIGSHGYGDVGAVVGATHPRELAELRQLLPQSWLLVPGYGAQGATAQNVRAAIRPDGLGAIINSSRGITFPFHPEEPNWESAIVDATRATIADLS